MHYDSIGISDLHLAAHNCERKRVRKFLHKLRKGAITTDQLLVMGDGVNWADLTHLRKKDWKALRQLRKLQKVTKVTWLVGNHDPSAKVIVEEFGIPATDEIVFESGGQKVFASHGHAHDEFLLKHPFITDVADAFYNASQFVDPTHTLARFLKKQSKIFVKAAKRVGLGVALAAKNAGCSIAWHGHNHHSGKSMLEGVEVWDSGCWTERPCTFLTMVNGITELHRI